MSTGFQGDGCSPWIDSYLLCGSLLQPMLTSTPLAFLEFHCLWPMNPSLVSAKERYLGKANRRVCLLSSSHVFSPSDHNFSLFHRLKTLSDSPMGYNFFL
ncbi:hypothetical protein TNCT_703611 [Trichonephila clavata]|uniref:Uncharacterized protein n=1 Tax=Trichonephila clavata TaxID=2740835 RepID=A0A8X6L1K7_TRICU|nr:hypothetical protein TNCT_703611 [Trichonephila clavata]